MEALRSCQAIVRPLTKKERAKVVSRLIEVRSETPTACYKTAESIVAGESLRVFGEANGIVCLEHNDELVGIVVYDVIEQWFNREKYLTEILVLDITQKIAGIGRLAITVLENLAKEYGCTYVVTGNSTQNSFIANTYKKCGYSMYPSFYKKIERSD